MNKDRDVKGVVYLGYYHEVSGKENADLVTLHEHKNELIDKLSEKTSLQFVVSFIETEKKEIYFYVETLEKDENKTLLIQEVNDFCDGLGLNTSLIATIKVNLTTPASIDEEDRYISEKYYPETIEEIRDILREKGESFEALNNQLKAKGFDVSELEMMLSFLRRHGAIKFSDSVYSLTKSKYLQNLKEVAQ